MCPVAGGPGPGSGKKQKCICLISIFDIDVIVVVHLKVGTREDPRQDIEEGATVSREMESEG